MRWEIDHCLGIRNDLTPQKLRVVLHRSPPEAGLVCEATGFQPAAWGWTPVLGHTPTPLRGLALAGAWTRAPDVWTD